MVDIVAVLLKHCLTLFHSDLPNVYGVLAILSAIGLELPTVIGIFSLCVFLVPSGKVFGWEKTLLCGIAED